MQNEQPSRSAPRGGDSALPPRDPSETAVTLAQVMLPGDANPSGNVHGGTLMKLADTAGGICACRHARTRIVTVVMDSMTFERPVYVGDLVTVHARVTWVGRTSVETEVAIDAENVLAGESRRISTAFFVYVALDEHGGPTPVPPLLLDGPGSEAQWAQAEQRREYRITRR
jgi:uncharacterized protein (TIGR00369 family)